MNVEHPSGQPSPTETVGKPAAQHRAPANWQPKASASGLRVATGVVALALSAWGILLVLLRLFTKNLGPSTPFVGWMNFFLIVGVIGCLVMGIVIIAKQRKRGRATPWLVLGFSVLVLLACLILNIDRHNGTPGGQDIAITGAVPVAILAGLVLFREKSRR